MAERVKKPEGPEGPEGAGKESEAGVGVRRGRPGRRSTEERTQAVLELLSGKAMVDQLAFRFGVQPSTVQRWPAGSSSVCVGLPVHLTQVHLLLNGCLCASAQRLEDVAV